MVHGLEQIQKPRGRRKVSRQVPQPEALLHKKVSAAREQICAGDYAGADEVEARFATRRAQWQGKAGGVENQGVVLI